MISAPDVRVFRTQASYPVSGGTAAALRGAIRLLGPTRGNERYSAFTDWRLDWSYRLNDAPGAAQIEEVCVQLYINILVPRWRPPRCAPTSLKLEWERYLAAVERHEEGHVRIAREAAQSVRSAFQRLHPFDERGALDLAATNVAREIIAGAHESERAYDLESNHGVTQGVWLHDGAAPTIVASEQEDDR